MLSRLEIIEHPRITALTFGVRTGYFALLSRPGTHPSATIDAILGAVLGDVPIGEVRATLIADGLLFEPFDGQWEACGPDAIDAAEIFPSASWHERSGHDTRRAVALADDAGVLGTLTHEQWAETLDYVARERRNA